MYVVECSPICVRGLVAVSRIRTVLVALSEQFESRDVSNYNVVWNKYGIVWLRINRDNKPKAISSISGSSRIRFVRLLIQPVFGDFLGI